MKFLERIRAIFNFKGHRAEMELKSAEIRGNKVYLHPADDPEHTFCVSGKKIDILIDPAVELTEDDFFVIENEKLTKLHDQMEIDPQSPIEKLLQPQASSKEKQPQKPKEAPQQKSDAKQEEKNDSKDAPNQDGQSIKEKDASKASKPEAQYAYQGPKMRTVSMRLYEDEYELLMEALDEKGYKKTEYLLACVVAAKKKSFESNYQKYYEERMRRRKEQREAARQAAEQQRVLEEQE